MSKSLTYADLITACYRVLLRREPEDPAAVAARANDMNTAEDVLKSFLDSDEYKNVAEGHVIHDHLLGNHQHDTLDIEVDVPDDTLARMFDRIKSEWAALGETEPFWSVITADEFRSANIRENMDAFIQSGRTNVRWLQNIAKRNGVELGKHQTCFELGCGVGRLTLPLAELFDHVTGYDISPGNLAECDALTKANDISNVTTKLMTSIEQIKSAPDFDVLFTIIVLQHNPPPVQKYILDTLLSKVRPGGVAYFQLPTYLPNYSFSASSYLEQTAQDMEMHAVPMHEVLDMLRAQGFHLREVLQDQFTGMPGSHSFFAVKSDPTSDHARRPNLWKRLTG